LPNRGVEVAEQALGDQPDEEPVLASPALAPGGEGAAGKSGTAGETHGFVRRTSLSRRSMPRPGREPGLAEAPVSLAGADAAVAQHPVGIGGDPFRQLADRPPGAEPGIEPADPPIIGGDRVGPVLVATVELVEIGAPDGPVLRQIEPVA